MPLGSNSGARRVLITAEERELHATGAGIDDGPHGGHGFFSDTQGPFFNTAVSSELDLAQFKNIRVEFYLLAADFENPYLWGDNVEISIFGENPIDGTMIQSIRGCPVALDDGISDPLPAGVNGIYKMTALFGEDGPAPSPLTGNAIDTNKMEEVDVVSRSTAPGYELIPVPHHPFLIGAPSTIYNVLNGATVSHAIPDGDQNHETFYNPDLSSISGSHFKNIRSTQVRDDTAKGLLSKSKVADIGQSLPSIEVLDVTSTKTEHIYSRLNFSEKSRVVFSKRNDLNKNGINSVNDVGGTTDSFPFWPCWFVVYGDPR